MQMLTALQLKVTSKRSPRKVIAKRMQLGTVCLAFFENFEEKETQEKSGKAILDSGKSNLVELVDATDFCRPSRIQ